MHLEVLYLKDKLSSLFIHKKETNLVSFFVLPSFIRNFSLCEYFYK